MKAFHRRLASLSAKAFPPPLAGCPRELRRDSPKRLWRVGRALQCAIVIATVAAAAIRAQSPRPMSIVDLLSLPRLTEPQVSPDGRDLVFTRSDADWKTGRRVSHVWRI